MQYTNLSVYWCYDTAALSLLALNTQISLYTGAMILLL
jgi:hypothetical protein